jgi:hypothetical protein
MLCVNFGCGPRKFENWVNVDWLEKHQPDIMYDLSEWPNSVKDVVLPKGIDYAYFGHTLSQFTDETGLAILKQLYKHMSRGGMVRVCDFDADWLFNVYFTTAASGGIVFNGASMDKRDLLGVKRGGRVFYTPLQQFYYDIHRWGWKFLYDVETITAFLIKARFTDVNVVAPNDSDHSVLRGLEIVPRTQFCVEARKR